MTDERDPMEPLDENAVPGKPAEQSTRPQSSRTVPRPSEVHPLNAVTGTPPPAEVNDDWETESALDNEVARVSEAPGPPSSTPLDRVSLVPHSRLTTTFTSGSMTELSARANRRPSAPSGPPSTPPSGHPPSASAPELTVDDASLRTSVSSPSHVPGVSLRPAGLSRAHTSIAPQSLKAKGLRPASLPPIQDKLAELQEEHTDCESNDTLENNQLRDTFLKRAQSALAHASTLTDPVTKGRYYVLASELYAMAGLPQSARLVAEQAAKLGNHLGHRQLRQLSHVSGDDKAASAAFASEINTAPNAEVRRHVATAATHFERWVRKDALSATRNSELLQRSVPRDPGPPLLKLARALGQNSSPPPMVTWHPESHRALQSANVSLQRLRGDTQRVGDECKDPVATFLEVRAALERRDRVAAAKGLVNLHTQPGYERSALWLAAALLSPVAATRDRAIELLNELFEQEDTKPLRRVLAYRAVEAGNTSLLEKVVGADGQYDTSERAFTTADRLSFMALGLSPVALDGWENQAQDDALRPLFRALAHANGAAHLLAEDHARNASAAPSTAAPRTGPDAVVHLLGELDTAVRQTNSNVAAQTLLCLDGLDSVENLSFVAATINARQGFTADSLRLLETALSSPVCGEAALHTLLAGASPASDPESSPGEPAPRENVSQWLELAANITNDAEHRARLLAHAALVSADPQQQVRLSQAAFAADPTHPLVEAVTERYASIQALSDKKTHGGEPPSSRPPLFHQLVNITNTQSVSGRTPYERAVALVRQALRLSSGPARDKLLAHAWELLPSDLTLLDWVDRSAGLTTVARARARERLLAHVTGAETRAVLRTEAALLYEFGGHFSDAARVAQTEPKETDVWQWCFQRNAPGTEFAAQLRKRVVERASTAGTPAERASSWVHAAKLAADAGDRPGERNAIDSAIRLDPTHLEGLLAAEALAFKEGEAERLAEVETLLAEAFPAPDSVAHARLAVRFLQAHSGSSAGYTLLLECAEGDTPSLDVARRLTYLAPRMGDDEVAYDMLRHLANQAKGQYDRAILLLQAANVAQKLGRPDAALEHAEQALESAPDYIPALWLRAELLAPTHQAAKTAEAYERLGINARSSILAGHAFKRAAESLIHEDAGADASGLAPGLEPSSQVAAVADLPRLRVNLERALEHAPDDAWMLEMLVQTYTALKQPEALSVLFTKRLAITPHDHQVPLALRFGQAFHALGADDRALPLVNDVLKSQPDDERALSLSARLATTDHEKEKALLQLVRVASGPAQQASAYKQLGHFYRSSGAQTQRAAKSYQEVLKRDPTDSEAVRALVDIQLMSGELSSAEQTVTTYVEHARSATAEHLTAVLRAVIVGASNPAEGALLLERLVASRPADETAVGELAKLYLRSGRGDQLKDLVRRTRDFAIHQVPVGDQLTESLKCVAALAQLTRDGSALALVQATLNLYHGAAGRLDARGSRALSPTLDDALAPAPLNAAVRRFLAQTAALHGEAAVPNEAKVTDKRVRAAFEIKARAASVAVPELYTSEKDPYTCVVLHHPPRIVLGATWVREAPQAVLDFLAWRCVKILQAGIGAFVHASNRDALAYFDALLRRYIDTQDLLVSADDRVNLRGHERTSTPAHPELEVLALTVLEQLAQSGMEFGDALRVWVNRSALLATGEPRTALQCIALSNGELNATTTGDAIAFAARNAEARDVLRSLLDQGLATAHKALSGT